MPTSSVNASYLRGNHFWGCERLGDDGGILHAVTGADHHDTFPFASNFPTADSAIKPASPAADAGSTQTPSEASILLRGQNLLIRHGNNPPIGLLRRLQCLLPARRFPMRMAVATVSGLLYGMSQAQAEPPRRLNTQHARKSFLILLEPRPIGSDVPCIAHRQTQANPAQSQAHRRSQTQAVFCPSMR
jgi:hypothetical protein